MVVVNLGCGRGWAREMGGRTALDRVLAYAGRLAPQSEVAVLLPPGESPDAVRDLRRLELRENTDAALIGALSELSRGRDNLYYVYGDCPFLDAGLSLTMMENHLRYVADYTFADGYPYGLAPEILKTAALPAVAAQLKTPASPLERDALFTLIGRDINSFDLETELSPVDLRQLRASLTTDSERNSLLCLRLAEDDPRDAGEVSRILQEKPEILRTLPAYIGIQIVEGCPQACFSCPYPVFGGDILRKRAFMDPAHFDALLEKIAAFCGDAVVGVSLWGEPSLHPDFIRLAESAARRPALRLLVETSGLGWGEDVLRGVRDLLGERVTWIVSLDASDEAGYLRMRGPGFAEAVGRAESLLELFPGQTYVQALRMKENEEGMETFFRTWREKTPQVIIQKYDHFCGFLPQRKVTDLSPLKRFPCRHLQRDLSVLIDGTVPLCREDLRRGRVMGNALAEDLPVIWARGAEVYREHLAESYNGICGACDEYYTFNF